MEYEMDPGLPIVIWFLKQNLNSWMKSGFESSSELESEVGKIFELLLGMYLT